MREFWTRCWSSPDCWDTIARDARSFPCQAQLDRSPSKQNNTGSIVLPSAVVCVEVKNGCSTNLKHVLNLQDNGSRSSGRWVELELSLLVQHNDQTCTTRSSPLTNSFVSILTITRSLLYSNRSLPLTSPETQASDSD